MHSSTYFYSIVVSILLSFLLYSCDEDNFEPELFGSISGVVLDAETSTPIEGASITTGPPTHAIVTNANGMFSIDDIPTDNYTITAKKVGYKNGSVTISVKEDETTNATILLEEEVEGNSKPNTPSDPSPKNLSTDQPTTLNLSWSASDPDENDSLVYDIYLFESNDLIPVASAENLSDTTKLVENLKYSTAYFWQVVVRDQENEEANGELWRFNTKSFPDNRIVYSANIEGNFEIYSANLIDTDSVKLTNRPYRDWSPRLSPNLDKIAFSSDEQVQTHIYTMNRDGSDVRKVTNLPVAGYHNYGMGFSWSPDGGRLLYANYEKLYSIRSDGSDLNQITTAPAGRHFRECEWAPQYNKITALAVGANIYDNEIILMDSDGNNQTELVANLPGIVESPSFSIDGREIIFTHDVSGYESADGRQLDAHVFIIHVDSTEAVDISVNKPDGTNDLYPRFSSDGTQILFVHTSNIPNSNKEIWRMDRDGNNRERIIKTGTTPDWK
ncbi:MAG: hypothetical protein HND52_16890 [Ignavibacteriae bacterium]|nr:hypothetical protein [Ignavibacteriota bacterium]NOG99637.1 hypothetical protein [Ignavibacteriota bacterium]